jgi:serine/threonine protein phosphatase 1
MLKLFNRSPGATLPEGRRVYAIGDIHGRRDLLFALCRKITRDNRVRGPVGQTDIILLGDLIDRGPESAGVLRFAMESQPPFATMSTIKGNHEALFLEVAAGETARLASWLYHGGREMLESFGIDSGLLDDPETNAEAIVDAMHRQVPRAVHDWIAALPVSIRIGDYLFVHAGIRPGVAIDDQVEDDLLWIREEFLDSDVEHGATIVHGHTVTPAIVDRRNRIGLDTGAYRSDRLSAVGLEGDERWFLDADKGDLRH